MLTEAVLIAVVTVLGGILVELIRARKRQDTVVHAVTPNGGSSMPDALTRLSEEVRELRVEQNRHGQRLAGMEAILGERARKH